MSRVVDPTAQQTEPSEIPVLIPGQSPPSNLVSPETVHADTLFMGAHRLLNPPTKVVRAIVMLASARARERRRQ